MHLRRPLALATLITTALLAGCKSEPPYTDVDRPHADPLFKQSIAQIGDDISELHARQPVLQERVLELARRNVGQPYDIYLLGEAPFETVDPQPVYNLRESDCVVFVEHTIAMALSDRFGEFMRTLQRIRYKNGEIGVASRNHFTEADWNVNNQWLLKDISDDVAGGSAAHYTSKVDRTAFFKKRYKLSTKMPIETIKVSYVPYESLAEAKSKLKTGDVIEFVKGPSASSAWVHHLGLIAVQPDGAVHVIHSTEPRVREEPIEAYVARATKDNAKNDAEKKARHRGFKFLRLVDDPIASLRAVDGEDAPRVKVPASSKVGFEEFIDSVLAE